MSAGDFTPGGGTLASNYVLPTTASGAGHITAVTLTASIVGNPTKTYNGNTAATLTPANFFLTPLVGIESFTVTQTVGTYNSKDVLTAITVTATLSAGQFTSNAGTLASNYVLPTTASGPGHINKANATVVVTAYHVAYDTNPHTATYTITGVNGETGATVGTVDVSNTTHTLPGTYATDYWFFTGTANYNNIGNTTISDSIGYGTCTGPNPGHQILPPINADGSSVWKVGSTVPVKFTVCDANGNPISDPAAVFATGMGSITLINTVRGTVNNVNEITYTDIPDSAFRWSGGFWIFNMATSNLQKNNTYTFRINLKDGSYIEFSAGTK
jgi:hypothetical protein